MIREESGKACLQDLPEYLPLSYTTYWESNTIPVKIILKKKPTTSR